MRLLVTGAAGMLGADVASAARAGGHDVVALARADLDITDAAAVAAAVERHRPEAIVNCAAWTDVDGAEAHEATATAINGDGAGHLAAAAARAGAHLVHVSSDYVFDGTAAIHSEDEAAAPLSVYGQTKAAGDAVVSVVPRHYVVRTSWVIGEGDNFVRVMASLAERGVEPAVVDDQVGRLAFTEDIAAAIRHLLETGAEYGVYNLSNDGEPQTWADIAADVYELLGKPRSAVAGVSSAEYFSGKAAAPRPLNSVLDLSKIKSAGFVPPSSDQRLVEYVKDRLGES
jgi:dTDP-4-dehydrorhamnose reductase